MLQVRQIIKVKKKEKINQHCKKLVKFEKQLTIHGDSALT